MPPATIAIVGTGSLGGAVCYSLASHVSGPLTVHVMGRSLRMATQVAYLAGTRAALSGQAVHFRSVKTDLSDADSARETLARLKPSIVLICASDQSPWEKIHAPSEWTALLERGGFGLTLPLQAAIPVAVASAAADAAPEALLVNACYPDAVNPVINRLGLPVFCGIGNVALLAASLQASLALPDQRRLRVLGHHYHLREPSTPNEEARVWVDDRPMPDAGQHLRAQRACDRSALNGVTAHAAALFLDRLLAGAEMVTSLPGPAGLPGGYPVRVSDRRITLDLPPGVTADDAVSWNQRMAVQDGVQVLPDGYVRFSSTAKNALGPYDDNLAAGFHATDIAEAASMMLALRERLRAAVCARPSGDRGIRPGG
jgi:hypothetical protein